MNGKLVVSLDFEMLWGMLDCATVNSYGDNVLGAKKAIPELLKVFTKYGVHATWATVGMMFAENAETAEKYFPKNELLPSYENKALSTYSYFEKIKQDEELKKYFFAPEIIKLISKTDGQEIACHTFSHYYCNEKGQTKEQFDADIKAAVKIAEDNGYKLSSIVLPRNQCNLNYLGVLKDNGFVAYRGRENDWIHKKLKGFFMKVLRLLDIYFPLTFNGYAAPAKENGVWDIPGSKMFKPKLKGFGLLEGLKVMRIKRQMKYAAKKGKTYHLWWHPHNIGVDTERYIKQLDCIFRFYGKLKEKYNMESLNMCEMAEKLEHENI